MLLASPMPPAAITGTLHRLDDLLHQREGADLRGDIGLEEHAAMAAGLGALRDDRIDAALGEPQRFAARRRRADDLAAGLLHARDAGPASGKPKWKLTTSGRSCSTTAQVASVNGTIEALSGSFGISTPSSA